MSEARKQASDVVACLELLVDLAEQIMKGQEPWAEVAVAKLTQYLADARELLDDATTGPERRFKGRRRPHEPRGWTRYLAETLIIHDVAHAI